MPSPRGSPASEYTALFNLQKFVDFEEFGAAGGAIFEGDLGFGHVKVVG